MKLSEAIRKGCKLVPGQIKHMYWNQDRSGACALGSAMIALGITDLNLGRLANHFPVVPHDLYLTITTWNDRENLSREEIADKLEAMGY